MFARLPSLIVDLKPSRNEENKMQVIIRTTTRTVRNVAIALFLIALVIICLWNSSCSQGEPGRRNNASTEVSQTPNQDTSPTPTPDRANWKEVRLKPEKKPHKGDK